MSRLTLLLLLSTQGCFLALDLSRDGKGPRDDDDAPSDSDPVADTDTPGDSSQSGPQVRLVLDPAEVTIGATTLLLADVGGDARATEVRAVDLGADVTVSALRAIDDATLALTVEVSVEAAPGPVDAVLRFDALGDVAFPDALTLAY